jgi:hypothetical protein
MKIPYTNPAIYGIYLVITTVLVYSFFFGGYQNVAYPIPLSIIAIGIFSYISFYFIRPLHPVTISNENLVLQINFFIKRTIDLKSIKAIEKYNRYDRLEVVLKNEKKITLLFILNTDQFVKDIQKKISRKGK